MNSTSAPAEPSAIRVVERQSAEIPGVGPQLILLDPGHGGTNLGAAGVEAGVYEKALTLDIAQEIAARLQHQGYNVALTRDHDKYLTLRQRVAMANQLGAVLFVSLHLNATPSHTQRGYETFILTPAALDIDARALRLEEGGPHLGVDRQTAQLLDDVERGVAFTAAVDLAAAIQRQLRAVRGEAGDRGVRQDSMHVLLGANMPAVLVEAGFIDHPHEGRELLDGKVRDQISAALAEAIIAALGPADSAQ